MNGAGATAILCVAVTLSCAEISQAFVLVPIVERTSLKFNPTMINASSALHHTGSPMNRTIEFEFVLLRPLKTVRFTATYYGASLTSAVQTALIKRTIDLCFFIQHPTSDRLLNSFYSRMLRHGSLPTGCPIETGILYYIRGLRSTELQFPGFLPESDFVLEFLYQTNVRAEILAEYRVYGKMTRFIAH